MRAPSRKALLLAANPVFMGWDAAAGAPDEAITLGHPCGDVLMAAEPLFGSIAQSGLFWSAPAMAQGQTAEGFSGGGLFDVENKLVLGALKGAAFTNGVTNNCPANSADATTLWGRFDLFHQSYKTHFGSVDSVGLFDPLDAGSGGGGSLPPKWLGAADTVLSGESLVVASSNLVVLMDGFEVEYGGFFHGYIEP